ncbi:hypothetical protein NDU88_003306 [Pleurodeles waltl]|uniref:Uncharacterized protein n=1 Tax=Pleurodeles waltl TaxID=8319 RepID=A0AAV7TNA3_PLEWA|nr:hypothetical protein NDU88_003306 [Pleurodeles waltl]
MHTVHQTEEKTTGKPPMAEEVKQALPRVLADVMAFGRGYRVSPTPGGESPIDREENNEIALTNVTTRSGLSYLSDSELDLPIVTPRTADDLRGDQKRKRLQRMVPNHTSTRGVEDTTPVVSVFPVWTGKVFRPVLAHATVASAFLRGRLPPLSRSALRPGTPAGFVWPRHRFAAAGHRDSARGSHEPQVQIQLVGEQIAPRSSPIEQVNPMRRGALQARVRHVEWLGHAP